ncbi:F-box domain [Macleaya cordata]|uniref:F-box domain n=1 Tax=Macleaya cordata TaxID=56857 RepID=A0A200PQH6_MACCD|nr:F-box domain [Macleaya cordata]
MWSHLPFDILARIFSFLSPDSLAYAASACKQWHMCATTYVCSRTRSHRSWFLAMHTRNRGYSCYIHNPVLDRWYLLSLEFLSVQIQPIAAIGSLVLYRYVNQSPIQLALCNPFTKQNWFLPPLIGSRINPAVGIIGANSGRNTTFKIFVAGGMSGDNSYEPTLEMYDSRVGIWQSLGSMPIEFAVWLTVWTSNESVYSKGVLYWITSARAYKVMGYELDSGTWKELNVPMADRLEFAGLVREKGTLSLVGGTSEGEAWIWKLGIGEKWVLIERVPSELGKRFFGCRGSWNRTKCIGSDEAVYLYRDFGSEMLVWREVSEKGRWEWFWVEGCGSIKGEKVAKFPIKGMLFQPSLDPSFSLS